MPETNDGIQQAVAATPEVGKGEEILSDLSLALANMGNRDAEAGHSAVAKAGGEKAAEVADAKPEGSPAPVEAPAPEAKPKTIDFSAYPDGVRQVFERLHKGEPVPPEELEPALEETGKGYLRQQDYTKKRMADAEARRKWDEQVKTREQHLAALDAILADPKKTKAFLAASQAPDEPEQEVDYLDPKQAAEQQRRVARQVLDAREAEAAKEREAHEAGVARVHSAVREFYDTVKADVTEAEMNAILVEAGKAYDKAGVNPADVSVGQLSENLSLRVDAFRLAKQNAELQSQLSKRNEHAARSAKASSPPASRTVNGQEFDLTTPEGRRRKTMADAGIENWREQVALGNRMTGK